MEYTLAQFMNHLNKITEPMCDWEIIDVIEKKEVESHDFLKWEKSQEDGFCPKYCMCEFTDPESDFYDENIKCEQLKFTYYAWQRSEGIEGDSFTGETVHILDKFYVRMRFSI